MTTTPTTTTPTTTTPVGTPDRSHLLDRLDTFGSDAEAEEEADGSVKEEGDDDGVEIPSKKDGALNSIGAMFQFQGGLSDSDREKIFTELVKRRHITIGENNRVQYPQ